MNLMQKQVKARAEAIDELVKSIDEDTHLMKLELADFDEFRDTQGSNHNHKIMQEIRECGERVKDDL